MTTLQKNPRLAFVTDHETEANLTELTGLGDITMSKLTAAIVEREAAGIPLFLSWLKRQEVDSDAYRAGIKAIKNLDRRSLLDSVRDIDPNFMTPAEASAAKLEEAEALLELLAANPDMSAGTFGQAAIAARFKLQVARIERRMHERNARVALDAQQATAYLERHAPNYLAKLEAQEKGGQE